MAATHVAVQACRVWAVDSTVDSGQRRHVRATTTQSLCDRRGAVSMAAARQAAARPDRITLSNYVTYVHVQTFFLLVSAVSFVPLAYKPNFRGYGLSPKTRHFG